MYGFGWKRQTFFHVISCLSFFVRVCPLLIGLTCIDNFSRPNLTSHGSCIDFQFAYFYFQDMIVYVCGFGVVFVRHVVPLLIGVTCIMFFVFGITFVHELAWHVHALFFLVLGWRLFMGDVWSCPGIFNDHVRMFKDHVRGLSITSGASFLCWLVRRPIVSVLFLLVIGLTFHGLTSAFLCSILFP